MLRPAFEKMSFLVLGVLVNSVLSAKWHQTLKSSHGAQLMAPSHQRSLETQIYRAEIQPRLRTATVCLWNIWNRHSGIASHVWSKASQSLDPTREFRRVKR